MAEVSQKPRKAVDLDAAFDRKVGEYFKSKKNKGKYSEEEWEDVVSTLYTRFAQSYIAKLDATPSEYYENMSATEIQTLVKTHFAQKVAIDSFFRRALENEKNHGVIVAMLDGTDDEAALALEVLDVDRELFPVYLQLLARDSDNEELQQKLVEILKDDADDVIAELLSLYKSGKSKDAVADICSHCQTPTEEVFSLLLKEFIDGEDVEQSAQRLARLGDERALPYIITRAKEERSFLNWRAMRLAVEALGGSLPVRDFSKDKDYQAIERAKEGEESQDTDDGTSGKN